MRRGGHGVRGLLTYWARYYGISPSLVKALAWQESGFQQHVRSSVGASGVMQVTRQTWSYVEMVLLGRQVGHGVDGNIHVGVAYLRQLLHEFHFHERRAIGAYYQGPGAVRAHGLYPETRAFVANVLGNVSMKDFFAVFSSSTVTGSDAILRISSMTTDVAYATLRDFD